MDGYWSSLHMLAGDQGTFINFLAVNQKKLHDKPVSFLAHMLTNRLSVPIDFVL